MEEEEDGRTANGKQVEGLPESQPGDRLAGMAQSVGEAVNSQIIPGNRLWDAHSYSLCVKWAAVKSAFSSCSCHQTEKYELWADAPGWEPGAGLWPPRALPHQGRPPAHGLLRPLPASPALAASISDLTLCSLVSFPLLFPLLSRIPSSSLFLSCESEGVVIFLDHHSASGTQHQMWHKWALSICRTNLSLLHL